MLVIGVRTYVPSGPSPVLPGGMGETLEGLTSVTATVVRIDVVHRTVLEDPSTEQIITIDDTPRTIPLAMTLDTIFVQVVGEFGVPVGFVLQGRLIVSEVRMVLRGEEHVVRLSSGSETGLKFEPIDGVPFEMIADTQTGARIIVEPFEALLRNRGRGFMMDPRLDAEHVEPFLFEPNTVLWDRVIVRFADGTPQNVIDAEIAAVEGVVLSRWEPTNFYVLQLPVTMDAMSAVEHFEGVPSVAYTLPDLVMDFHQGEPDDPIYPLQAQWPQASVDEAYAAGFVGSYLPVVAVVDTGVFPDLPDLNDNLYINVDETVGVLTGDIDSNGFRDGDFDQDGFLTYADLNGPLAPDQCVTLFYLGLVDDPTCPEPRPMITPFDLMRASNIGLSDDDDNGWPNDLLGWDFRGDDPGPFEDEFQGPGHGTHVAGIIGAVGDNGMDLTGVAQKVRIMPLAVETRRFSALGGTATTEGPLESDTYLATLYAAANGAHVINMSFGYYVSTGSPDGCGKGGFWNLPEAEFVTWSDRLDALLSDIHDNLGGALLVSAVGNCELDGSAPGIYDWPTGRGDNLTGSAAAHLRVTAVDLNDELLEVSGGTVAFGVTTTDIAAPGTNYYLLTSPGTRGGTEDEAGTSFANAFVSGVAALLIAADPTLAGNGCATADRLLRNADSAPALVGVVGVNGYRVNALGAITDTISTPVRSCP